jgi:PB1 domain
VKQFQGSSGFDRAGSHLFSLSFSNCTDCTEGDTGVVYRKQTFPLFGASNAPSYYKKIRAVAGEQYKEQNPYEDVKGKLSLLYVDTDGDKVEITNEDELAEAVFEFSSFEAGRTLRILAHEKPE